MSRLASLFSLFLLIPAAGCGAQETEGPAFLYEAYYKVGYADLPEWNRMYFEYSVPIFEALRDRGVIEGWGHWVHQTGGDYNIRMAIRTYDWNSLDVFWDEYLRRMEATIPAADLEGSMRMIRAHRDEIWDFGDISVPPGTQTSYMYAATYQYNFADTEEWNRIWGQAMTPLLRDAQAEGLLGGWVTLVHNTGGSHNFKVLFVFDEWDKIDDFTGTVLGRMAEEHPQDFQRFMALIQAHDDAIYEPVRAGGM